MNHTDLYFELQEDPRIDHTVLTPNGAKQYDRDDHVLTISSAGTESYRLRFMMRIADELPNGAGCNAFDYLIEGSQVTAVDFNSAQIALTELKAVACMDLEFEDYFSIFAKNNMPLLREKYDSVIRAHLSDKTRKFWDRKMKK